MFKDKSFYVPYNHPTILEYLLALKDNSMSIGVKVKVDIVDIIPTNTKAMIINLLSDNSMEIFKKEIMSFPFLFYYQK